jgi:hypothetical protein
VPTVVPKVQQAQLTFFKYLFGDEKGFLCIATGDADKPRTDKEYFKQFFFSWPSDSSDLIEFLEGSTFRKNVWFCTSLLGTPKRIKENCLPGRLVWADLDTAIPTEIVPAPSCAIQSSEFRFQAIWRAEETLEPYQQEEFSKRIAYRYNANGVDPSGWDLTQLLRVPFTFNYKYEKPGKSLPQVDVLHALDTLVPVGVFEAIEVPENFKATSTSEAAATLPDIDLLPGVEQVLYKYMTTIEGTGFRSIFATVPDEDANWSAILWKFINMCFEAGMDEYEVFALSLQAGCNKYARDNRPVVHLWEDVLRALSIQRKASVVFGAKEPLSMPVLVNDSDVGVRCFVDDYSEWAKEATDAIPYYHDLCAFMLLSTVMAGGLVLETDFGRIIPNIWGLILGDSTLTRKTTAMNMAMDMAIDVDKELILATDGTAEGMLTGLEERPGRTSVFLRDEITGFFDSINQKQYLAGVMQTMTQLYDVPKVLTRRLSKSTITVNNPVFIFFGGGISDKTYSLIDEHYVISGFLPRFLVVDGEADISKLRRIGRAVPELQAKRAALQMRVADLYERNNRTTAIRLGEGIEMQVPAHTLVDLTDDALARYGEIENKMLLAAKASTIAILALPTFERLSRSILKMSMLVAGSITGKPPQAGERLVVEEAHIAKAASYVQEWGNYTVNLVMNSGRSSNERTLEKVLRTITSHPDILRGHLMRFHGLSSREANEVLTTLEDRGHITITKVGKGYRLKAV